MKAELSLKIKNNDIDKALKLADQAIKEWLIEIGDEE
jgi:hypothetical protein